MNDILLKNIFLPIFFFKKRTLVLIKILLEKTIKSSSEIINLRKIDKHSSQNTLKVCRGSTVSIN